jgi:hypothetical protein
MPCDDCNDTGFIEVESITIGRPYYDREKKCLVNDITGKSDWHMAICPCVGEDE